MAFSSCLFSSFFYERTGAPHSRTCIEIHGKRCYKIISPEYGTTANVGETARRACIVPSRSYIETVSRIKPAVGLSIRGRVKDDSLGFERNIHMHV